MCAEEVTLNEIGSVCIFKRALCLSNAQKQLAAGHHLGHCKCVKQSGCSSESLRDRNALFFHGIFVVLPSLDPREFGCFCANLAEHSSMRLTKRQTMSSEGDSELRKKDPGQSEVDQLQILRAELEVPVRAVGSKLSRNSWMELMLREAEPDSDCFDEKGPRLQGPCRVSAGAVPCLRKPKADPAVRLQVLLTSALKPSQKSHVPEANIN